MMMMMVMVMVIDDGDGDDGESPLLSPFLNNSVSITPRSLNRSEEEDVGNCADTLTTPFKHASIYIHTYQTGRITHQFLNNLFFFCFSKVYL